MVVYRGGIAGRELDLQVARGNRNFHVFLTRQINAPSGRENTGLDDGLKILTFKA